MTLWTRQYQQHQGQVSPWIDWGAAGEECLFLYTVGTRFKEKKEGGYMGHPLYREVAIEAWDLWTGGVRDRFPVGIGVIRNGDGQEERTLGSLT